MGAGLRASQGRWLPGWASKVHRSPRAEEWTKGRADQGSQAQADMAFLETRRWLQTGWVCGQVGRWAGGSSPLPFRNAHSLTVRPGPRPLARATPDSAHRHFLSFHRGATTGLQRGWLRRHPGGAGRATPADSQAETDLQAQVVGAREGVPGELDTQVTVLCSWEALGWAWGRGGQGWQPGGADACYLCLLLCSPSGP